MIQTEAPTPQEKEKVEEIDVFRLPHGAKMIDDAFFVWKTKVGLHETMTIKGRKMLTGLKEKDVVEMTRWHLKCEQDGTLHLYTRVVE